MSCQNAIIKIYRQLKPMNFLCLASRILDNDGIIIFQIFLFFSKFIFNPVPKPSCLRRYVYIWRKIFNHIGIRNIEDSLEYR